VTYRDPLDAARHRIAALEELLEAQRLLGQEDDEDLQALRQTRAALAEERADHHVQLADVNARVRELERENEAQREELVQERARRQAEVSLLRSKLEEAERLVQHNGSLFEAEQTMQRAQAEAESARLRQVIVQRDTALRELREEIRVHLTGDSRDIRAHYEARVRAVGTELAECGALKRKLEKTIEQSREALRVLPPADTRDREGMVERELLRRKVAVGEAELERVRERLQRLEGDLERITDAEAKLASRARPFAP
jgi:chromosome segregation ATPase